MAKKHELIEHTAGFSGIAMPRIKGTRIRVSNIAFHYMEFEQATPADWIQRVYPQLSIEEIEAAIDYWREHPEEIAEEMASDEALFEELKAKGPIRPK
jgi:uncharacterized protein (DUF433 family)